MPRAMLEAAACARPLIVSDVSGCRHFVNDGVEGMVVAPEDVTVLAEAMRRLAADPVLRERMGAAARRKLLAGFTEGHVKERLRGAYRHLLPAGVG
jgi:glycosyltransferase involved in cell wall biosynthesis